MDLEGRLAAARVDHLRGHMRKVTCLAWNKTGSTLASGSADGTVRLWHFEGAAQSRQPPTVLRYPPPTPAALPPGVDAVAWSPEDPTLLAVAGADRHVRFLDARTGKPEAAVQLKAGAVLFMAWHPDGSALAVGTSDDTLYFLSASRAAVDARRTGVLYAVQQSCEMNELAWTPSGLLFVSVGPKTQVETFEGAVSVLKPREGFTGAVEVARVRAHTGQIQALRFDPSFRLLATSSTDSTVALWSAEELAVVRTFDRLEFAAKSLSFSHDGALLATASDDKVVDVLRVADGARLRTVPCGVTTNVVAWAPHAHLLAFVCEDKEQAAQQQQYGSAPQPDACSVRLLVVPSSAHGQQAAAAPPAPSAGVAGYG